MNRLAVTLSTALLLSGAAHAAEKPEAAKAGGSEFPDLSSVLNDLPAPNKPDPKAPPVKKEIKPEVKPDLPAPGDRNPTPAPAAPVAAQPTPAKAEVPSLLPTPAAPAAPEKPKRPGLDVSRMIFDAESIRQVVNHHMPDIQECFEKVIADTGKKYEGKVVVGFIVGPDGFVQDARVLPKKTTLKNERVHECVLEVRRWQFPKPDDDRIHPIEYPFNLKTTK